MSKFTVPARIMAAAILAGCLTSPADTTDDGLAGNPKAMRAYLAVRKHLPIIEMSDWTNVKTDITPAALGDGVADDTVALQAAFAKMGDDEQDSPRIFYFPAGTYRITDTLTLTKVQGGGVYGHGDATRIIWDGPAGGRMFHSNGFARSMWYGLTFDGAGKAGVGVDHDSKTYYETRVRYQYCSFANFTDSGIRVGHDQKLASAELMFYDLLFTNCKTGISTLQFNDYDNSISRNIFLNCGIGINIFRGNAYVRDCHFENSREADIKLPPHSNSVRRCTSVASNAFIMPSQGGRHSFLLAVQECYVSGWRDAKGAIQLVNRGPVTVFDSVFDAPAVVGSPAIDLADSVNHDQRLITANVRDGVGKLVQVDGGANATHIEVPRKREMLITQLAARRWRQRPAIATRIFDARTRFGAMGDNRTDDTAAIQAAINAARAHGEGAMAYLPVGKYRITKTLRLPPGRYTFGGSVGWRSELVWAGAAKHPMVHADNANGVRVKQLSFRAPKDMDITSLLVTADERGHFVCDGIYVSGSYQPRFHGLRLESLPAGFSVYAPHVNGETTISSCGDARILIDDKFAEYKGPLTIIGGSGGRGFTGINSMVSSNCDMDVTVEDNASIVFGDFYSESTQGHLLISGKPGQKPGRVTLSAGKQHGVERKLTVDGYAGQITLSRANFMYQPSNFAGTKDGNSRVLMLANAFHPVVPQFNLQTGKLTTLGNLVWNDELHKDQLIPDSPLDEDTFAAVNAALDHFRELSRANFEVF